MAIRRACSYTATIQTPEDPTTYSAILVTVAQNGTNIFNKDESDLVFDDGKILLQLDQTETKQLSCGKKAFIQVRCYKSQYEAPGSAVWAVDVCPALNDEVLS